MHFSDENAAFMCKFIQPQRILLQIFCSNVMQSFDPARAMVYFQIFFNLQVVITLNNMSCFLYRLVIHIEAISLSGGLQLPKAGAARFNG